MRPFNLRLQEAKPQISRANSFIYALLHINKSGKHRHSTSQVECPCGQVTFVAYTSVDTHSDNATVLASGSRWISTFQHGNLYWIIKIVIRSSRKHLCFRKMLHWTEGKSNKVQAFFRRSFSHQFFWPSKSRSKPRPRYQICVLHFPPELLILWWGTSIAGGDHLL